MAEAAAQDGTARRGKRAAEEGEEERGGRRRRSFQPAAEPLGTTVLHAAVDTRPQPLPARYFDTGTTEPVSFFLSGLEELLAWHPSSDDEFNVCAVPLAQRQPPLHSRRPRTLLCHDMRGGYLEDRCVVPGGQVHAAPGTHPARCCPFSSLQFSAWSVSCCWPLQVGPEGFISGSGAPWMGPALPGLPE